MSLPPAVPSTLMPLPSRSTSAGLPVVLDTALLPCSPCLWPRRKQNPIVFALMVALPVVITREGVLETLTHLNQLTEVGLGYRQFHRAVLRFLRDLQGCGFSPRSPSRKKSDSANAGKPAWQAPAVGETGAAGQKRSRMPQKLPICAQRATHGAKLRRKQESAKELHSGLFLACPKIYDLRLGTAYCLVSGRVVNRVNRSSIFDDAEIV